MGLGLSTVTAYSKACLFQGYERLWAVKDLILGKLNSQGRLAGRGGLGGDI